MKLALLLLFCALSGCAPFTPLTQPASLGERNAGFSYIPIDPLPVSFIEGWSCYDDSRKAIRPDRKYLPVLDALPDNAVRIAIKEYDVRGKISLAAGSLGTEGKRYQVVLDYINVDSTNVRFAVTKLEDGSLSSRRIGTARQPFSSVDSTATKPEPGNVSIPVYVGVGLRLTADIQVLRGTVNLASLGAIAAGVEGGRVTGSLILQTLGISGRQIATSLPLPSELNQTTVQNSILALGAIKAVIYDEKGTTITPRVTGIYLPLSESSEALVNSIVSELARDAVIWLRECYPPEKRQ
jgi:hypothetical protein